MLIWNEVVVLGNRMSATDDAFLRNVEFAEGTNTNFARALLRETHVHPAFYIEDADFEAPVTGLEVIAVASDMELKVYPNPVEDVLYIEVLGNINTDNSINVLDITGKQVDGYELTYSSGKLQINVASLASGAYLVELVDAAGNSKVSKFIKR